jgi:hypothetical protein
MDTGRIILFGAAFLVLLIAPASAASGTPGAAFVANITCTAAPAGIAFTDTSDIPGVLARNWSFGDGAWYNTSGEDERMVVHAYPEPGTYTVTLSLTTPASVSGSTGTVEVFARQQAISVSSPSGVDNLAVLFNVTHLDGMRPDFADIRFVDEDGASIPHWKQDVAGYSHAHVWLALPADATGITMLYGNPSARETDNPDAVFLFFEDYERGDLSRWSFCGSNAAVQSEVVRAGAYAGDINVSEPDIRELAGNRLCLANISAGPIIIEGDFQVSRFGWWCGSGYIQAWSGTDRLYALHLRNSSVQYYDGVHRNFSADARAETGTWYHIKVVLDTLNATQSAWMDGVYLGNAPMQFADGSPVPPETVFTDIALIGSSAWERGDPHHFYLDNIIVRNYVPIEPVLTYAVCCEEGG